MKKIINIILLTIVSVNISKAQTEPVVDTTMILTPWTCYDSCHIIGDTLFFNQNIVHAGGATSNIFQFNRQMDSITIDFTVIGKIYPSTPATFNCYLQTSTPPYIFYYQDVYSMSEFVPEHHHITLNLSNISTIPLILNYGALDNYYWIKVYNISVKGYWVQLNGVQEYNKVIKEHKLIKIIDLQGREITKLKENSVYIYIYSDNTIEKKCFIK